MKKHVLKPHICPGCGKRFDKRKQLKAHLSVKKTHRPLFLADKNKMARYHEEKIGSIQ